MRVSVFRRRAVARSAFLAWCEAKLDEIGALNREREQRRATLRAGRPCWSGCCDHDLGDEDCDYLDDVSATEPLQEPA